MAVDVRKSNAMLVDALGSALRSGEHGLGTVPSLLKRVLAEGSWREFVTKRGEVVEHGSFEEFVATPPLHGLGASLDLIERIVDQDDEAVQLLRATLKGTRNNITGKRGTRRDYLLERLTRDHPGARERVAAGELTAYAAAVEVGITPRMISVRVDSPDAIARTLRRNLTPDVLSELRRLLAESEPAT